MGSEEESKNNVRKLTDKIINSLNIVSAVITILLAISSNKLLNTCYRLINENSLWFLSSIARIGIGFVGVICLVSWLWLGNNIYQCFKSYFLNYFYKDRLRFCLNLILSISIIITLAVFLQSQLYSERENINNAEILFPQADELGPIFIQTYGTNGVATYSFSDETQNYGPHGYAIITLKANDYSVNDSAGWVMYLLKGADIRSRYNQLRFQIKGEEGGEKVVIKAKDVKGRENYLMLSGKYLPGGITNKWQQACIPLDDFGDVDFSQIDNFGFAITGSMDGTVRQTIYVGGFELIGSNN